MKVLLPADSLTIQYTTLLLENNTDEEWRLDRNGRVADLLVDVVRVTAGDNYSRESMNPKKLQIVPGQKIPVSTVEEILVTAEQMILYFHLTRMIIAKMRKRVRIKNVLSCMGTKEIKS